MNINKFIGFHLFFSLLVISTFVIVFDRSFKIVALHLALMSFFYYMAFVTSKLFKNNFKWVFICLTTFLTATAFLLYVTIFVSNSLWNDNVTITFIMTFLGDIDVLLEDVPHGVLLLNVTVFVIYMTTFILYSKHLSNLKRMNQPALSDPSNVFVFVSIVIPIYFFVTFDTINSNLWEGEPISHLALRTARINVLNSKQKIENFSFYNNKTSEKPNVIIIHADALSADRVGNPYYHRKTTPFINSLLKNGAQKIEMGLSLCSESICGIESTLSSKYFAQVNDKTPLIYSHLRKYGYRVILAGSGKLSWEGLNDKISHDVDYFFQSEFNDNYSINDDNVILSSLLKIPEYKHVPSFFYLHFMSSHISGRHFSQYNIYRPSEPNILSLVFPALNQHETNVNAYDNRVLQVDDFIRKAIGLLDSKGYIKNSIIVIYGDHGDALNEHGYYGHYTNLHQEEIDVPIIFINSNERKLKNTNFATLYDIMPTVLDLVNIKIPKGLEGISLLKKNDGERISYHNSRTGIYAIVDHSNQQILKLIVNTKNHSTLLYDLTNDPKEKNNIFSTFDKNKINFLYQHLKKYFQLTELR